MRQHPIDRRRKAEALELAAEHGRAWAAIGVPLRGPARRVLAALMRQTQAGQELGAPATDAAEAREALRAAILAEAEAAPRSIREQIGSELQAHALQLEEGDGQRALPASDDDRDARDSTRVEEMVGASRVIRTPPERRQARSASRTNGSNDVEVVDGEVVDKQEGWGAAAAGRNVPDGRVRPRPEQDHAERAKAGAEPDRQPQTSAPGDLYGDPSRWCYR